MAIITIYCGQKLLYAPSVVKQRYVLDAKLTDELKAVPKLTLTVPRDNEILPDVQRMISDIRVYDEDERIFRGRVFDDSEDFYGTRTLIAEGDLAFLGDVTVRPYTFPTDPQHASVADYFAFLIGQYNDKAGADKQFVVGEVTVTDPQNYIVRENKNYPTVLDEIMNKCVNLLGGYVQTRCVVENGVEVTYIDYIDPAAEPQRIGSQVIRYASNLLDLTKDRGSEDLFTVIIPRGATPKGADDPIGIKGVTGWNDDDPTAEWPTDYIANDDAVAVYGWIEKIVEWNDVTQPLNLWRKANKAVTLGVMDTQSLTVSAIDLSEIGQNAERMRLGYWHKAVSAPHGLSDYLLLSRVDLALLQPDSSTYTFGAVWQTASTAVARTAKTAATKDEVATAISVSEAKHADSVVQYGTSDGWNVRVWKSGLRECWKRHAVSISAGGYTAWGSIYNYSGTAAYPTGFFADVPSVSVTPSSGSGVWCGMALPSQNTKNAAAFTLMRAQNTTGATTVRIDIYARSV